MYVNMGAEWDSIGHEEKETRHFQRVCEQLQAAKASGNRVLAGEAYAELDVRALHSNNDAIRQDAVAMIDQAELEWYLNDIEKGAPLEEWLFKRIEAYDRAAPGSKRRNAILTKIRGTAEAEETPLTATHEMRLFLAAPDQWPALARHPDSMTREGV